MAFGLTSDARQYPLVYVADIAYTDFTDATELELGELPQGAVVTGVQLLVDTAWDSATSDTLDIGDTLDPDRYTASPIDITSTGELAGVAPTGFEYTVRTNLSATWDGTGTAPSAGAGKIVVQYYVVDRQNENEA